MTQLNDQFQGGLDPVQDHSDHSRSVMETRLVRYACRVSGLDELGMPIIQDGSTGDVVCGLHWPAGSRPIGAWAGIFPTVGGSKVHASGASSSASDGANQAKIAGGKAGANAQAGSVKPVVSKKIDGITYTYDDSTGTWRTGFKNVPSALNLFGIGFSNVGVKFTWTAADREGYNTGLYEIGGRGFYVGNSIYVGNGTSSVKSSLGGAAGPQGGSGNAGSIVLASSMDKFRPPVITSETMASTAVGIDLYPIRDSSGRPDTTFQSGGAALPFGWPSIVPGSRGAVLAGTEHTGQYPVYLHSDPRMVAVNAGPDPDAGSVVYDTDDQGGYDANRFGRLQSLIRVMPPFTGSLDFGKGGTLAHQHARGERDGVAGYGAYVDLSSANAVSRAPSITPSGTGPVTTPGVTGSFGPSVGQWNGNLNTLGSFMNTALMNAVYAYQAKLAAQAAASKAKIKGPNDSPLASDPKNLNEPILTVGLASARVGGPIEPGHGKKDRHRVGQSGESAVNIGHLATHAPWYADMTRDGPLPFERTFYPNDVDAFPLKSFVHLQFAPGEPAGGYAFGPHVGPHLPGVWKMWAEVPEMKEGPRDPPRVYGPTDPDPPPPTKPPPPTTPSNPPAASTRRDIFWWFGNRNPLNPPTGTIGGGGWAGAGATSRDGLTNRKASGMGSPLGVQVRNPDRSRAARRGIGIGPVDLPTSAIPIEPTPRVSTMLPMQQRKTIGLRPDTVTTYPTAVSFTTVLSRPTDLRKSQPDIRSSDDIDGTLLRSIMRRLPVVLREEAWGAFNGTSFTANQQFGSSRYSAPTGSGGKLYLPPEFDMKDVEAGSSVFTPSTSYVMAYTGVHFAVGIPDLATGGMKTGYKWAASAFGSISFDRVDSSGVETSGIFGGSSDGKFFVRETGGSTLLVNAITDGQFLKRSGTTIVSAAAAALTSGRVTNGVKTTDDVIIDNSATGLVLKDSAGTPHYWRVSVSTLGVLSTADLGTTSP